MTRRWVGAVLVLALPGLAAADDDYRHGRIRHVEDGVSIQRAAEPGAEEAQLNIPFLPGDRIWTDERGRVEFQFDSGAFLRLDNGTKLDYLDNPGDRVVLRLWSGALYVHAVGSGDFEIETPGGVVNTRGRGIYRIDAHSGETRISVYEGDATLQGGRGARIREGERAYARDGEVTRGPMAFDRQDADDFAMWADDRQESVRTARQRPADLPEDAAPFYDELSDYGSWDREPSVGFVWRPRVAFDWQPYTFGRWMWTAYGWTWASSDPWGWAPFHYGRWGYSLAGWYWIPQRGWGPAWVSWAVGGPYVGWSPLGLRNRPIHVFDRRHRGLHEIPRVAHAIPRAGHSSWVYARQGDLTARDLVRRRVHVAPAELAQVRALPSSRARLSRELSVVEAPVNQSGPPRAVRTGPTIGDTVPELRTDNQTTVPFPVARRRREPEERHDRGHSFGEAAGHGAQAPPPAPEADAAQTEPASRPAVARPTFGGGDAGRARWRPESSAEPAGEPRREAAPVARSRPRANDGEGTPRQGYHAAPAGERSREGAAPRERTREGGGERRSAPAEHGESGGAARSRGESAPAAPRQESASAPAAKAAPAASGHAVRRQRD
jgi:uncharacterized protein DUF6600/FecR-like protein